MVEGESFHRGRLSWEGIFIGGNFRGGNMLGVNFLCGNFPETIYFLTFCTDDVRTLFIAILVIFFLFLLIRIGHVA